MIFKCSDIEQKVAVENRIFKNPNWNFGMRIGNVFFISLGADVIPWIYLIAVALIVNVPTRP